MQHLAANDAAGQTPASTPSRRDIAEQINMKILALLDQGILPWRKPWDSARTGLALPRRVGGEFYRGANVIMLWCAAMEKGYKSPYWLSFRQAQKFGAYVRKGERGESVIYYGQAKRKRLDQNGMEAEDTFRFLKSYSAFNARQIENLPDHFYSAATSPAIMPMQDHECWFERLEIARILTRDSACYIPSRDVIGMPPIAIFDTPQDYAATLNHESVHATMATHRLNRDLGVSASSPQPRDNRLATEELVAEIGSALLGAHLNLPPNHIHDHAAYIGSWMKLLNNDKRAFLSAASKAQAAVDWLLAKSPAPRPMLADPLEPANASA